MPSSPRPRRLGLLQPMWRSVEDLSPDVWLWIGDAVYVDKFSDGGVKKVRQSSYGVTSS